MLNKIIQHLWSYIMKRIFISSIITFFFITASFAAGYYHELKKEFVISGVSMDMNKSETFNVLEKNGFDVNRKLGKAHKKAQGVSVKVRFTGKGGKQIYEFVYEQKNLSNNQFKEVQDIAHKRFGKPSKVITRRGQIMWYCDTDNVVGRKEDCLMVAQFGIHTNSVKFFFKNRIPRNIIAERRRQKEKEKNVNKSAF